MHSYIFLVTSINIYDNFLCRHWSDVQSLPLLMNLVTPVTIRRNPMTNIIKYFLVFIRPPLNPDDVTALQDVSNVDPSILMS